MLFQSYALFPHLSVYENVAFELRVRRVSKREIDDRVRAALELVRLGVFADRKPAELSGGQRQRVALARAVVGRPAVVLLDEPLGALDQKLRKQMQFELKRMQREVGITFIYVTHDQEEALTMSDRIAVMSEGRVQQIGTPTEIYDAPTSRFVAGFIGSCNLLEGTLTADGAAFSVPGVADVPVVSTPRASRGTPLTLAVRPERVRIVHESSSGADGGSFALPATLSERIFMGDEWVYHLALTSSVVVTASVPSGPTAAALAALADGTRLAVTWDPADGRVVEDGVSA
jgi:spermidine/putrescine transport system ATP-binding protein